MKIIEKSENGLNSFTSFGFESQTQLLSSQDDRLFFDVIGKTQRPFPLEETFFCPNRIKRQDLQTLFCLSACKNSV